MESSQENKKIQDKQQSKSLQKHDGLNDSQLLSINIESLIYIYYTRRTGHA